MVYNPVLVGGTAAWAASQIIKVVINLVTGKGFVPERFVGSGGMPSSHSATVSAASVTTLRICGAASPVFGIAILMSIIVIYDALNVRYQSGLHGAELNRLRKKCMQSSADEENSGKDFKELLGHTPSEVMGGIVLGILMGVLIPVKI